MGCASISSWIRCQHSPGALTRSATRGRRSRRRSRRPDHLPERPALRSVTYHLRRSTMKTSMLEIKAADKIVRTCATVRARESVVIVTDPTLFDVADKIAAAVYTAQAD